MAEDKPSNVTDAEFDEKVLKAKGFVIVDFWAPWCGPCHQMAPALEAFTKTNAGKVKVFKLDTEDNPKTAEEYEIKSIPTIIFFQNGEPVKRNAGAMTEATLQSTLDSL